MKISGNSSNGTGGAGAGAQPTTSESVIERRYPGVVRALVLMWGHPELTEFLDRVALGLDERLRDIEPAALAELMLLAQVHQSFCPRRKAHVVDAHPALRGANTWGLATQRR